jgi:hypothetical protein
VWWVFVGLLPIPGAAPGCEQRDLLSQAASPDGVWTARIYYNVCSDGYFVTTVSNTVEVRPADKGTSSIPSEGVVFGMDVGPYDQGKPLAAKWTGARNLEITIPNDAWAGRQASNFADVSISYRYVSDDPVERACLRQWRSLPSEVQVRRSQSPTENLRAFLARCNAKRELR